MSRNGRELRNYWQRVLCLPIQSGRWSRGEFSAGTKRIIKVCFTTPIQIASSSKNSRDSSSKKNVAVLFQYSGLLLPALGKQNATFSLLATSAIDPRAEDLLPRVMNSEQKMATKYRARGCCIAALVVILTISGCSSLLKKDDLIPGIDRPFTKLERAEEIASETAKVVTDSVLVVSLYSVGEVFQGFFESVTETVLDKAFGRLYSPGDNRELED